MKDIIDAMSQALARGPHVEIRGFGSFSLSHRAPRMGLNPKTGIEVAVRGKFVPQFRPGKAKRDRVAAAVVALQSRRKIAWKRITHHRVALPSRLIDKQQGNGMGMLVYVSTR